MITNHPDHFVNRHIGPSKEEQAEMLKKIGVKSIDQLIDQTIPRNIRIKGQLNLPEAQSEFEYLNELAELAKKNLIFKNYIGQGYYGTITPAVNLRNIFQNPGWYTQYTPYQAEIAQGRLEALLNFQTMVSDLTGLPVANASLLDEGTAAAEAMSMFYAVKNKRAKDNPATKFFIDRNTFAQTIDVVKGRAIPMGYEIVIGDYQTHQLDESYFGALIQYPNAHGSIEDYAAFTERCKTSNIYLCVAADLLSLALITPPGEWGAEVVVGNTQRFGVPMGYGGPHAAYFATLESFKRQIPGRIIGVSKDRYGNPALRMALQTREQHIKREKATSNICTAQALLAIMASMYAVYHGPKGIRAIAQNVHTKATYLAKKLLASGVPISQNHVFDTLSIEVENVYQEVLKFEAEKLEINFFYAEDTVNISIDETTTKAALDEIVKLFKTVGLAKTTSKDKHDFEIPKKLKRKSTYLEHPVFSEHQSETKMMRYIKSLENKDLSLTHSMIALGSCTMKLNAAAELIPVSWPAFANIHPFAPLNQTISYQTIFDRLEKYLCEVTGFTACSLQPNSGAQGELSGLMIIRAYHESRKDFHRNVALIPSSAHGTNPASAVMTGMKVVVVACDDQGNVDLNDLKEKIAAHKDNLSSLMVTYPSTHGVFESHIKEVCEAVHDAGGMVYMDGANMNAQVGYTNPNNIGADVCHLNLHKTFAIPHGGGGPGMGPICCNDKLKPFLPKHKLVKTGGKKGIPAVAAAPWGSASILLISYGYIRMLGAKGVKESTAIAILNANYMKARLESHYPVLFTGEQGRAAHEMILDLRQFKALQVTAEDVAKRLIDYGFHAPTLSFPVAGTVMIEPTESESIEELDRFCEAMISIKKEIDEIASGATDQVDNVLNNAPHTLDELTANEWNHSYSREKAAYPLPYLKAKAKFWATVGRVDNAHGDRNLICTCPPIEAYVES